MIKGTLSKTILRLTLGFGAMALYLGGTTALAADMSDINSSSTKEIVQEVVDEGSFDSSELSDAEIAHICNLYGNDPETIRQLQRQSDYAASGTSDEVTAVLASYTHSSMFKGYTVLNGIDVSEWNGDIDWKKVKESGVSYAIIRVGGRYTRSGGYFTDSSYEENIKEALAAGLDVGVYFFSAAINTTEAKQEAAYVMKLISGYNINLPVVMDYEYESGHAGRLYDAHLSKNAATNVVKAFCSSVEAKGYVGMIYASMSVLRDDMNPAVIAKSYPVWTAQYNVTDDLTTAHSYWQYSSTGVVPGMPGATDLDFRYIKKPVAVKSLTQKSSTDSTITLTWKKVPEVYGYQIVRYDETEDKYISVGTVKGASKTTFTDTELSDGKQYTYKVRGYYKLKSGNIYGSYSDKCNGITIADNIENFKASSVSSSSIKLTWTPLSVVTGYRIYRYSYSSKKYVTVATIDSPSASSYIDSRLGAGVTYKYKIKAYTKFSSSTIWHKVSNEVSAVTLPGKVTGLKVTGISAKSLTLSWNKEKNIDGYLVYVWNKKSSAWDKIAKLSGADSTSYTHSGLKAGTEYSYSVMAYYKKGSSYKYADRSAAVTTCTGPSAPKKLTVSARTTTSITLTWRKVPNASGYIIYKYDSKKKTYKRVGKITDPSKTSLKVTKLKSTTSYTFAVKAYRTNNKLVSYGDKKVVTTSTKPVTLNKTYKYTKLGSKTILRWSKISGASGYIIYKYNKKTHKYARVTIIRDASVCSYIGKTLPSKYGYRIRVYKKIGSKSYYGSISDAPIKSKKAIYGNVTAGLVRVRSSAGTNGSIITELPSGKLVQIIGCTKASDGYWYKVRFTYNNKKITGYMFADYIKIK